VNPADLCVSITCNATANQCVTTNTLCPSADACTEFHCIPATGLCGSQAFAVDCDDDNACTLDYCDSTRGGCVHDARVCPTTGDKCRNEFPCDVLTGECNIGIVTCDDGIECTDDSCDSSIGCVFVPDDGDCVDPNPCYVAGSGRCDVPSKECIYTDVECPNSTFCNISRCADGFGCVIESYDCGAGNLSNTSCDRIVCDDVDAACETIAGVCFSYFGIVAGIVVAGVIVGAIAAALIIFGAMTGGAGYAVSQNVNNAGHTKVNSNPLYKHEGKAGQGLSD